MGFVVRGEGDLQGSNAVDQLGAEGRGSTVQGGELCVAPKVCDLKTCLAYSGIEKDETACLSFAYEISETECSPMQILVKEIFFQLCSIL